MCRLRKENITEERESIRNLLSKGVGIRTQVKTPDNRVLHHRSTTKAEKYQMKIYHALGLSPQILKAKKYFSDFRL
jgi:hypothetical protein